jgi:hypothetical protein
MKKLCLVVILVLFGNITYAETLLKGSVICWSEETLKNYVIADDARKKHMEEHECGVLNKDIQVEVISSKLVTVSDKFYSISNIVWRYENYGQRVDNIWTFTRNLTK